MATESLIIELDAKTAKLDARLKTTEKKLEKLNDQTKKNDSSFKKFGGVAISAAKSLAVVATAALAVGTAITAMTLKAASSRKELESFARQAKTTAEDFQALSFATSQYGINAEKIADISKDISDKVGEFAAAGTGTFQDYADVMKLTKEEARTLAIEFQSLSSEEVIGKMVSEMEAAGTSGAQMTFVLESMGSDLSTLLPLYQGNSKELLTLKKRFSDVNDSLQITGIQAEKLKAVSTTYGLLTSQLGNAATAVSATIAPVMDDFFNDIIAVVPDATQSIIDFINTFLDAENITSVGAVNKQIKITKEEIEATTALMETQNNRMRKASQFGLNADTRRLKELEAQLAVLQEQEISLANANRLKGGSIDGSGGSSGVGTGDELQAIADRFKTEEDLLTEKLERELEVIGEHNANKAQLEQDFIANMADAVGVDEEQLLTEKYELELEKIAEHNQLKLDLEQRYIEDLSDIEESKDKEAQDLKDSADKKKEKREKKSNEIIEDSKSKSAGNMLSIAESLAGGNEKIGKAIFLAQKALGISDVFIQTERAAARALAELGPVAGPPAAAAIKTSGYISMAAIAASALGGGGGGSSSSSSTGGGTDSGGSTSSQQENFEEETTGLRVTDASSQGSGVQTIRFAVDSGDELIDAISSALNKANNEGR
tara:strand:- start:5926 stop:7911 length:1986 start_codon:yes stop_codon:yes gene_type:complete